MLSWLSQQWSKRPLAVIGGAFAVALLIDSITAVWGERRPVGGFFEGFLARLLHWGTALGLFAAGVWFGIKIFERTKSRALGWTAGILFYLVVGFAVTTVTAAIPGVNWRIDRLMSSED